jgi:hypothetical protein
LYRAFTGDLCERLNYVKLWGASLTRALTRIVGVLPKFGEATAFLETL